MINKRTAAILISTVLVLTSFVTGCSDNSKNADVADNTDTLYQVSTLNALMMGYYDGIISIKDLIKAGDTGLGTFNALDGEMIILDGKVFQAKADGTVKEVIDNITVPFAAITYFDNDLILTDMNQIPDIEALKTILDQQVMEATGNPNIFYAVKITGDFNMVHVRSVPAQEKPYKQLKEIAASQPEFVYENISGTIVAFRCPDYVAGINLPGWHLHFISTDRTKGGHLLDLDLKTGESHVDFTNEYTLFLPENSNFGMLALTNDLQDDTEAVEGK